MLTHLRPAVDVLLAVGLSLPPAQWSTGEGPCPSFDPSAPEGKPDACIRDGQTAWDSGNSEQALAAFREAFLGTKELYAAGRKDASVPWLTGAGIDIAYYAKTACEQAPNIADPAARRAMLDDCVALLETYISDLEFAGTKKRSAIAASLKTAREYSTEISRLRDLDREKNPAPPAPLSAEDKPSAPAATPPSKPENKRPELPMTPSVQPVAESGTTSPPGQALAAPEPGPEPAPRRVDAGLTSKDRLYVGLATSLTLMAGSGVMLGLAWTMGRTAVGRLEEAARCPEGRNEADCSLQGSKANAELVGARGWYTTGAIGLGVSLAAVAVLSALLIRKAQLDRPRKATLTPRFGPATGFVLHF